MKRILKQKNNIYIHIFKNQLLFYLARMPPTQAESVIKNIIREIGQECASHGEVPSETLVAFMVRMNIFVNYCFIKKCF